MNNIRKSYMIPNEKMKTFDVKTDCYFYSEVMDMGAIIPTCGYYRKYGYCLCKDFECSYYIRKSDVFELVVKHIGGSMDEYKREIEKDIPKYKAVKDLIFSEEGGWIDYGTIPKGTICKVKKYGSFPTLFYGDTPICDVDSDYQKAYFEKVSE